MNSQVACEHAKVKEGKTTNQIDYLTISKRFKNKTFYTLKLIQALNGRTSKHKLK